jgi:hypothetical protein
LPCGLYPSQVSSLLHRDITPEDYDMLLQLDEGVRKRPAAKKHLVENLPSACKKDFSGQSCVICWETFTASDNVISLECTHVFHRDCISKWLLEHNSTCPLCGNEVKDRRLPCLSRLKGLGFC